MPLEDFTRRLPENVSGGFYVTDQCLDCDFCCEIAPTVFARRDDMGYSFVAKQPSTDKEWEGAREAVQACPCEAIFDDGDAFDWNAIPPADERKAEEKKNCPHCEARRNKPWWKFR